MSHKYLDNPEIEKLCRQIDSAVSKWQSGRMRGDYSLMCFALGMMHSTAGEIYRMNASIDQAEAILAIKGTMPTPAISEELVAAFPEADASELAYEGERPPRIEDELSAKEVRHTHPATAANLKIVSPQARFEAGQDYQAPS